MSDPRQGFTSASNAQADSLCPGRHLAQRGIPEPARGADATSGQRIHQALAQTNETPFKMDSLTLEEREVFDACRAIEKKTVLAYFGQTDPVKEPVRVFRHLRHWVRIQAPDGTLFPHSGEADVIFRSGTRALIADYKTLAGDTPDSPKNLQLRDLAVLAWGNMPPLVEIATVIIQPFVTHSPELCVYSAEDLATAQTEMQLRVAASNNPDSQRIPGSPQCDFCLAKSKCVEYLGWAGKVLPPQLFPLDVPMVGWTPEQRARAADALGPAFDLLNNIKESLKAGIERDPNYCPGYVLQPGNKRETITNPQELFNRFTALGGTIEQFMVCVSIGKGKLREATNEVTGAKGMGLDKAIKLLTDGIVEISQNAPSLKKVE